MNLWNYISKNDWENISLHDCKASRVITMNTDIILEFDDGFWIIETNSLNPDKRTFRTAKSMLILKNCHCISSKIIVKKRILGKLLWKKSKMISWGGLSSKINLDEHFFEFINEEYENGRVIYEVVLHSEKKPYHTDCIIEFSFEEIHYCWNEICKDRPW